MHYISITAYNNEHKAFKVPCEPDRLILDVVNEHYTDPKREGIPFICRKGVCRSCVVHVQDGAEQLVPPSPLEQRALQVGKTTIALGYRLACMTRFKKE